MHDNINTVVIFCPDCRGKFEVGVDDFREEELLECALCSAEVLVTSEDPPAVKLFVEEDDF